MVTTRTCVARYVLRYCNANTVSQRAVQYSSISRGSIVVVVVEEEEEEEEEDKEDFENTNTAESITQVLQQRVKSKQQQIYDEKWTTKLPFRGICPISIGCTDLHGLR